MSVGWGQDTTPPELIDFNMSPLVVDVSESPDTLNFNFHVTDDLSGIEQIYISLQHEDDIDGLGRTFYTNQEGILDYFIQVFSQIPTGLVPGVWFTKSIEVQDYSGNRREYHISELEELGFYTEFEVINDSSICDGNGDFNDDGNTNVVDIVFLVNCILFDSCIDYECSDINNNGSIDIIDVIILVNLVLDQ